MNKKLTYTEEMKKQDLLWETEDEDRTIMESLYKEIITEAKEKGFKGKCVISHSMSECNCEVYESEEEYELLTRTEEYTKWNFGNCTSLIEYLENIINGVYESNAKNSYLKSFKEKTYISTKEYLNVEIDKIYKNVIDNLCDKNYQLKGSRDFSDIKRIVIFDSNLTDEILDLIKSELNLDKDWMSEYKTVLTDSEVISIGVKNDGYIYIKSDILKTLDDERSFEELLIHSLEGRIKDVLDVEYQFKVEWKEGEDIAF